MLIWVIATLLVLGELGINLAPLIAGAGIAGIALGFGAQNLVKDCVSGLFMLIEDQYGIGDVVDLGVASGPVEQITLRTTVLRGQDGTVWHVPNGEIRRVGNRSKLWSVAVSTSSSPTTPTSTWPGRSSTTWRRGCWRRRTSPATCSPPRRSSASSRCPRTA